MQENIARAGNYIKGKGKYYGRFNQGVITVNLPYLALESKGNIDTFWKILDETSQLIKKGLMVRHNRLKGTKAKVAPILWQHGALARLDADDVIDPLLYNNYSTISYGYAGLYECVHYLTGKSHTDDTVREFALNILRKLNDYCNQWKAETNISFSLYGTPLESTTQKFADALKRDFGQVDGVTDHDYVTNSYHVHVTEKINAFDKLDKETLFQQLTPGGAISYIEVPDLSRNPKAVLTVMKHIYDTCLYAEINSKFDTCHVCGFEGEIKGHMEDGTPIWECPNCGNTNQEKMTVVRRTCGYIGSNFWNRGRSEEIMDRVLHL